MTIPTSGGTPPGLTGMTLDLRSLEQLKGRAASDPKGAANAAARQLESLFMQELMKSMRATTMDSGLLDNAGSQMGTEMLDTEFATRMSGLPGGLSAAITRQIERAMGVQPGAAGAGTASTAALAGLPVAGTLPATTALAATATATAGRAQRLPVPSTETVAATGGSAPSEAASKLSTRLTVQQAFVQRHQQAARAAEASTGIPAANLIGQAAHETGWGRHEIRNKDGTPSHNLFGIKAGASWTGKVAEVTTTEYVNGVARKVTAKFRSYGSYEEAFTDHARLLSQSPRYAKVVSEGDTARGYAQNLQRAGYATDPAYADKLTRVINTTLRLQRAVT